jgi:CheY-like chemotaxis protein
MSKIKVCLLVEDDPEDQEIFIEAVHGISANIGCYAVSNGEEALSTLINEDLVPDYIFTDINMPRMDGLEFMKALCTMEKFKSIPVIVFSSDTSDATIQKVKELGARAIYSKTRLSLLPEILRKYLFEGAVV